MKVRSLIHVVAALTIVSALAAAPASASGHGRDNDGEQTSQQSGMSADEAASIVRRAYGGRVVSVKPAGSGYNVRVVLDGGRVKNVQVDANGRLSESN